MGPEHPERICSHSGKGQCKSVFCALLSWIACAMDAEPEGAPRMNSYLLRALYTGY